MNTVSLRRAVLAVPALSIPLLLGAAAPTSAHWKTKSEIQGRQRGATTTEGEMWMKDKKVRMQTTAMGSRTNVIVAGDSVYQWREGDKTGTKMSTAMRQKGQASSDYVHKLEEYRTKGKKMGTETVSGHVCDVYEYETNREGSRAKETVWIARELGFPVRHVFESGGTKVVTTNSDIQVPASVPDALLQPPGNVEFQDLSETMKRFGVKPR